MGPPVDEAWSRMELSHGEQIVKELPPGARRYENTGTHCAGEMFDSRPAAGATGLLS